MYDNFIERFNRLASQPSVTINALNELVMAYQDEYEEARRRNGHPLTQTEREQYRNILREFYASAR